MPPDAATHHLRLTPKHKLALRLYAVGYTLTDAGAAIGINPSRMSLVASSKVGVDFLNQIQNELDEEFKNLYGKVIHTLRVALDSGEDGVKLAAANIWFKASGKYKQQLLHRNVTAEEIIQKLLTDPNYQVPPQLNAVNTIDVEFEDEGENEK